MKMRFLTVCLLLHGFIQAQKDSTKYFLNQLRNKELSDSARAHYSLKLSDEYLNINPEQSVYYARKAVAFSTKANEKYLQSASQQNLASAFLNCGKADSSLQYAMQSLALAKDLQNPPLIYDALGTLGNVYLEKNQLPLAKKLFDEAMVLVNADSSISHKSHIYVNLGYYYYKNLEIKKGIEIVKQGELIAKKEMDQPGLMDVYSCLGHLYSFANKPDSAQAYFLPALEFFHKTNKPGKEAQINLGLGITYGRNYNLPKMEQFLSQAYTQFKTIGDNSSAANALVQKALAYFTSFQLDKCSQTLNLIESESLKFNLKNPLAITYLCKAAIAGIVGDSATAGRFQRMGEEAAKEMNMPSFQKINMLFKAISLTNQSKAKPTDSVSRKILSILQNEVPKEIIDPALQNFTLNKKLVSDNREDFINLFQILDLKKNLDSRKFIDSVIRSPLDSNLTSITNRQLLELETHYQTKQKDDSLKIQSQQLVISRQEVQNRNVILGIIGITVVLLSALIFFIYRSYKKERKDKARIFLLQKELQHKVKNDLAILIRLAEVTSKKEEGNLSIKELENRIKSIASVHEQLYASNDIGEINFKTFTEHLSTRIQKSFGTTISFQNNIDSGFKLSTSNTTPLALIINELMTNSFKYAFADSKNNQISITMKEEEAGICFYYHDNGPGVTNEKKGFGFKLIQGLSSQMNGRQRTWNEAGFNYELIIPS